VFKKEKNVVKAKLELILYPLLRARRVLAHSASGTRAACAISGRDPGYDETAKMVSEAALTILFTDPAELPANTRGGGGVLTPAAALGEPFAARLVEAGMCFDDGFDLAQLAGEPDAAAEAAALEVENSVKDAW